MSEEEVLEIAKAAGDCPSRVFLSIKDIGKRLMEIEEHLAGRCARVQDVIDLDKVLADFAEWLQSGVDAFEMWKKLNSDLVRKLQSGDDSVDFWTQLDWTTTIVSYEKYKGYLEQVKFFQRVLQNMKLV